MAKETKKADPKAAPAKAASKKAPEAKAPAKKAAPVVEEKEVKDVHVLTWVDGKGWAVKREGSDKVIKYHKTKIEGLEYIMKVSENTGTRVVVHLKNGKFQKFENAKRALSYAKSSKDED